MRKALSSVLSLVLVTSYMFVETGCTKTQFDNTVATINQQLPLAVALAGDIGVLVDSESLGPDFQKVATFAQTDLPAVQRAVSAYLANKTKSTKDAIFASVNSLVGEFNAQFLALNNVINQKTQQAVLAKLASLSLAVNALALALAPFFNNTVNALNSFHQVAPFIPREEQERVAAAYGYRLEDVIAGDGAPMPTCFPGKNCGDLLPVGL